MYWNRKFYERERAENKNFIKFIEKLKANPHGFRITAAQSSSLRKFLRKEVVDKELRIMQHKIKKCLPQPDDSELNWSYGITGEKLVQILSDWKVDALPCDYYRMTHSNIDDLKLSFNAFKMPFEMKLFSSGDLRKLKSSVKVF